MKTNRWWPCVGALGLGLTLTVLSGCQTNVAGMTLPSGHYLQHPPQYFPPSPPFPLTRELAQMQGAGPGAAPVPPVVAPAPAPLGPGAPLPGGVPPPASPPPAPR